MKTMLIRLLGLVLACVVVTGGSIATATTARAAEPSSATTKTASFNDTVPVRAHMGRTTASSPDGEETCDNSTEVVGDVTYDYRSCASTEDSVNVLSVARGKAAVDQRGRLILSFIMENGVPASGQHHCKKIAAGKSYVNNYYDSTGKERWVKRTAPAGGVKICFFKGKWRVVKCGNVVIMKPPPAIRKVLVRVRFTVRSKQKTWSEAVAISKGSSYSQVTASVHTDNCHASATGRGSGSFVARATARAWAWSKREADIAVTGEVKRLKLDQEMQDYARANSFALAKGHAKSEADANVGCTTVPPEEDVCPDIPGNQPPGYECTPPNETPPSVQLDEKNDVDANNTATVCADFNVPGNHTAVLKFGSGKGSYPGGSTFTVSGLGEQCTTWKAPSNNEVPAGGYTETLTGFIRDNMTDLTDEDSTTIRVNSTPQPPL